MFRLGATACCGDPIRKRTMFATLMVGREVLSFISARACIALSLVKRLRQFSLLGRSAYEMHCTSSIDNSEARLNIHN